MVGFVYLPEVPLHFTISYLLIEHLRHVLYDRSVRLNSALIASYALLLLFHGKNLEELTAILDLKLSHAEFSSLNSKIFRYLYPLE
jgi:hypothetical protein